MMASPKTESNPPGWTNDDTAILKEYAPDSVNVRAEGTAARCRIVITNNGEVVYASGVYVSGADESKIHPDLWINSKDDEVGSKSNKDAERKALTDIIGQTGLWNKKKKRIIRQADAMYVMGSRGPCKCCKVKLKAWAEVNHLTLKYVYASEGATEDNKTVGGKSGFPEAQQYGHYWIYVPEAVAAEKEKKSQELDLFSKNALEAWRKNNAADGLLKGLKKQQKELVLKSVEGTPEHAKLAELFK